MSKVVRESHDGKSVVIFTADSRYAVLTTGSSDVSFFPTFHDAVSAGDGWRVPSPTANADRAGAIELADAAALELSVTEHAQSEKRRIYRVPKNVRVEACRGVRWADANGIDGPEVALARRIARSESVDINTVTELRDLINTNTVSTERELGFAPGEQGYPSRQRIMHALLGGDGGQTWTAKTTRGHRVTLVAGAFVFDGDCIYFAGGEDPNSTHVDSLYLLRPDDSWAVRKGNDWEELSDSPAERPQLIELDEESAAHMADWLDDTDPAAGDTLELQNINPVERNLFLLASAQMDWEQIWRASEAVQLAGLMASDDMYTPEERRINAQRQQRATDGKFGGGAAAPASAKRQLTAFARARLSQPLPLVPDIGARINEYLQDVEAQRGAAGTQTQLAAAPPVEQVTVEPPESDVRPLYLAIVDNADTEAVLDVIALVPPAAGAQGDVTAWRRSHATWVSAPDALADLRGTTPPPVVELADDELTKSVLSQVDQADSAGEGAPQDTTPVEMAEPIRASAEMWGPYGEIIPIYGPSGNVMKSVLVSSGVPGVADTPSDHRNVERLKNYWRYGEGAAKVRWGFDGDFKRCVRAVRKYMTRPGMAEGFCANLHKDVLGAPPGKGPHI